MLTTMALLMTVLRSVDENTTSGNLGLPITATDADGWVTLTYSVAATTDVDGGDHLDAFNRDFSLHSGTGQITVKSSAMIDYETLAPAYTVLVQVGDGADESGSTEAGTPTIDDSLTLMIDVTDVELENFLTINDVTVTEPATGTATATFTVTVDPALPAGSSPATVSWQSAGRGSEVRWATSGTDFTAISGTLTFNAGETSKTIDGGCA